MCKSTQDTTVSIRERFRICFEEFEKQEHNTSFKIHDEFFESFTKKYILQNPKMIPPLFRYSPADYYNIRNLETETLMLSSIGNMNDIFEGLSGEVDTEIIDSLDELKDIAFIKSFSEQKNDLLMWSHYGDEYAGMCIEYDFSGLDNKFLYHLFPIIYSNKKYPLKVLGNAVKDLYELKKANTEEYYPDFYDSLLDIMALFLRKSSRWEMEKEWRIIATYPQIYNSHEDFYESNNCDASHLFSMNDKVISVKGCIKTVYIGPRMKNPQREHIKEICSKLENVAVKELKISKYEYGFEY